MNKSTLGLRLTFIMTTLVLGCFVILLVMNTTALMDIVPSHYIAPNDVRGMAVLHKDKPYTLNFEQQNAMIKIFNSAIPVGKELVTNYKVNVLNAPDIQKVIIYRFNGPDIEVIPVAYVNETEIKTATPNQKNFNMVFSVPEWNKKSLLEESTPGGFQNTLNLTYDP